MGGKMDMKTLILNGSPRKNGDTAFLQQEFLAHLKGEYRMIHAYDGTIRPCIDCRYCWKNPGCSIQDGMQELYEQIQEADNILIASPIFFSEISGPLLSVTSRLQTYFCGRVFRKEKPVPKAKKGGILLIQGGDRPMDKGLDTVRELLAEMNAGMMGKPVCYKNSDRYPPDKHPELLEDVRQLARFFNEG